MSTLRCSLPHPPTLETNSVCLVLGCWICFLMMFFGIWDVIFGIVDLRNFTLPL